MITAYVGAGGKTTLLKARAAALESLGRRVFITTTTHMFIEEDTLLTDDPETILERLNRRGAVMAGIPERSKICSLSPETFAAVSRQADVTLVEADGSKHFPIKHPNETEPVIPENTDEIVIVSSMGALGKPLREVCHRWELASRDLGFSPEAPVTPEMIAAIIKKGYLIPLGEKYPRAKLTVHTRGDETPEQRAGARKITELLKG